MERGAKEGKCNIDDFSFFCFAAGRETLMFKPRNLFPTICGCYNSMVPLVHSCFTFAADADYLKNNIRVKPNLEPFGSLGDVGWYCIRASLLAANYEFPKTVIASPEPVLNQNGVILECGASLYWEDGKVATFRYSFLANFLDGWLWIPSQYICDLGEASRLLDPI
ncbi:hypothetical protein RIF29_00352 [Crotalaria pallida]|uniref:Oxidoreductase n=1 Tax=Crotalaria pallida TaxID=3830 RepID=A0AAN9IWF4_CROPI